MSHRLTQKASQATYKVKGVRLKPTCTGFQPRYFMEEAKLWIQWRTSGFQMWGDKEGGQGHLGAGKLSSVML